MLLLVYGWYGRHNVGDQLMALALRRMFEPLGCTLRFVPRLTVSDVEASGGVVFGGGSILFDAPDADEGAIAALLRRDRPAFYLGVGAETGIHEVHRSLLSVARVVTVRSLESLQGIKGARLVPDLVYSLPVGPVRFEGNGGLLVVPNVEVVPTHSSPHWAHVGWERFKDELAQALDVLIERHSMWPSFLLMCRNDRMDDAWPAQEIVARMENRSPGFDMIRPELDDVAGVLEATSQYTCVLTQRYHGIVLAQMAGVPHVSVGHHDKLKQAWPDFGSKVTYHGVTKRQLVNAVSYASILQREQAVRDTGSFERIAAEVVEAMKERKA